MFDDSSGDEEDARSSTPIRINDRFAEEFTRKKRRQEIADRTSISSRRCRARMCCRCSANGSVSCAVEEKVKKHVPVVSSDSGSGSDADSGSSSSSDEDEDEDGALFSRPIDEQFMTVLPLLAKKDPAVLQATKPLFPGAARATQPPLKGIKRSKPT